MTTILTTMADEGSPYFVRVAFADEDGSAVTPNSAAYTVTARYGTVIGSLSSVEISSLATSVDILLTGADVTIGSNGQVRILSVEYIYDSTLGSGLTAYTEAQFTIDDLVAT